MSTNIPSMTSQWRHDHDRAQNSRFSVTYSPKLKISLKKVLNIEISPGFSAYKRRKLHFLYTFKTIQSINFSKCRLLVLSGGNHPIPAIFDSLPYPPPYPRFLFSSKWPQRIYFWLPRWLMGHFLFGFGATGKKLRGGLVTTPPPWEDEG